jgi:hypothetical protein
MQCNAVSVPLNAPIDAMVCILAHGAFDPQKTIVPTPCKLTLLWKMRNEKHKWNNAMLWNLLPVTPSPWTIRALPHSITLQICTLYTHLIPFLVTSLLIHFKFPLS